MKLTRADKYAIQCGDAEFINNKGAHYYNEMDFEVAVEYYHLAASMGSSLAVCNLGYCYMYGKGVASDTSLAISYFRIAADNKEVEALYKLGKIYCLGYGVEQDTELGCYYYDNALSVLDENYSYLEYLRYPALFHAMAIEMLPHGGKSEDLFKAFKYLLIAELGYTLALEDGRSYYANAKVEVSDKMADPIFDDIREKARKEFEDEYLNED